MYPPAQTVHPPAQAVQIPAQAVQPPAQAVQSRVPAIEPPAQNMQPLARTVTPRAQEVQASPRALQPGEHIVGSAVVVSPSRADAATRSRPFERQLWAIRVPAFVSVAVFAISLASIEFSAMSREQDVPVESAPISTSMAPATTTPAAPAAPEAPAPVPTEAPPVRFTNPFDRSEVFNFPAGTTNEEARTAVAEILLERARTRLASNR
jgi:hypothetical protein